MRWLFRKHRKKSDDIEVQDTQFKEPKKSILRSKDRDSQQLEETNGHVPEMSMADLRNTTITGVQPNDLVQPLMKQKIYATSSLRSIDSGRDSERSRRNVLFLDEVLTRKKQLQQQQQQPQQSSSNMASPSPFSSPTSARTDTHSGGQQYFTFASYPASYQPSPVFAKRESDSTGIELISRSPLPKSRLLSEDSWETWSSASTSNKDIFRNFSLTRRKKQKKQRSTETFSQFTETFTLSNGISPDPTSSYTGLNKPSRPLASNVASFSPDAIASPRSSMSATLASPSCMIEKQTGSNQSRVLTAEEPILKRPIYPRIIEPHAKSTTSVNGKNDLKDSRNSIILIASNTNLTDSNATLRPAAASSGSLDTISDQSLRLELMSINHPPDPGRSLNMSQSPVVNRPKSPRPPPITEALPPPLPKRQPMAYTVCPSTSPKEVSQPVSYRSVKVARPNHRPSESSLGSPQPITEKPPIPNKTATHAYRSGHAKLSGENEPSQCRVIVVTRPSKSEMDATGNSNRNSNVNYLPRVISVTPSS